MRRMVPNGPHATRMIDSFLEKRTPVGSNKQAVRTGGLILQGMPNGSGFPSEYTAHSIEAEETVSLDSKDCEMR